MSLETIGEALKDIIPQSILFTALPKPKIDFVREIVKIHPVRNDTPSLDDIIIMSDLSNIFENFHSFMSSETLLIIEELIRGQSENELWYEYRKHVVSASRAHDVQTKMIK